MSKVIVCKSFSPINHIYFRLCANEALGNGGLSVLKSLLNSRNEETKEYALRSLADITVPRKVTRENLSLKNSYILKYKIFL